MIVVGILAADSPASDAVVEIARRAAAGARRGDGSPEGTGPRVEVLGTIPGDAAWDRVTIGLAQAGVGHATVVRSARGSMEPADLDLALRYLPDVRAIVLVAPPAALLPAALAAATWSGAPLILIGPLDADATAALEARRAEAGTEPIVIDPPVSDSDGTFAGFVAALAVRLEAGEAPEAAWRATVGALAADRVG